MRIPVMIEPAYHFSVWCERTLSGLNAEIARKKYTLRLIDGNDYESIDYTALFEKSRRMLIVIGTSVSWIPRVIEFFSCLGVAVILVSYQPPEHTLLHGVVRMDYVSAMHALLRYLGACGKPRVALYGFNPNSSADRIKQRYFCSLPRPVGDTAPEDDIFFNYADLDACFARFAPCLGRYDAVICANDIVAVSLMEHLRHSGVSVPDALFVTCFGDSRLTRMIRPTITTASLDHVEMGRQAVALYAYLYRQPDAVTASIRVACKLLIRESTGHLDPPLDRALLAGAFEQTSSVNFYSDVAVQRLCAVDNLLSACDALDMDILRGMLDGKTYEQMEETLNTTASTLRYRTRRMVSAAGLSTREALLQLLEAYPLIEEGPEDLVP